MHKKIQKIMFHVFFNLYILYQNLQQIIINYKTLLQMKSEKLKQTIKKLDPTAKTLKQKQQKQQKQQKPQVYKRKQGIKKSQVMITIPKTQQQKQLQAQQQEALNRLCQLKQFQQKTLKHKTTYQMKNITQLIQNEIITNHIKVPQQSQSIDKYLKKKQILPKQSQDEILQRQYKKLIQKKNLMKQQLVKIQEQQNQLRNSSPLKLTRIAKMPQISQQDKLKWRGIRTFVKQNQAEAKRRIQINQQKMKKLKQQQYELQQKKTRQRSQQKRKQLQTKIAFIKQRHNERTAHIQQQRNIIQRLKKKKKLYQKMQQQWLNYKSQIEQQQSVQQLQTYLQRRRVNMRQISNHQKKYDQQIIQEKQRRKLKVSQSMNSMKNPNVQRSSFWNQVLEQENRIKMMEQEKINQIKDLFDKKKQYATIIKQKFLPKSRMQTKLDQSQKKNLINARSLSSLDINNKGNQYMRSINKSICHLKGKLSKLPQKAKQQTRYKNYLSEVKMARTSNSAHKGNQMVMINEIMKKQNVTQEEKFYQAQIITRKIQSKGTSNQILKSINAKIQILKNLANKPQ